MSYWFCEILLAPSPICKLFLRSFFFDSTIYVDWTDLQQSALSHFKTSIQLLIFPLFITKLRESGCVSKRIIGSQTDIWDSLFVNQLIICSRAVHAHRNQEPYWNTQMTRLLRSTVKMNPLSYMPRRHAWYSCC